MGKRQKISGWELWLGLGVESPHQVRVQNSKKSTHAKFKHVCPALGSFGETKRLISTREWDGDTVGRNYLAGTGSGQGQPLGVE